MGGNPVEEALPGESPLSRDDRWETISMTTFSSTTFWDDVYLPAGCHAEAYPALHKHCPHPEISVRDMIYNGIHHYLVPCLSRAAEE
jgi:hypothetical protein